MSKTQYRIYMNDGEIFNVPNDAPLNLDDLAMARWMEVQIPYAKGKSKKAFLNIAQINRIEIIEEVEQESE